MTNKDLLKLVNSYLFFAFWRNIFTFGFIPANPVIKRLYTHLNDLPKNQLGEKFIAKPFFDLFSRDDVSNFSSSVERRSQSILSIILMALGFEEAKTRVEALVHENEKDKEKIENLNDEIISLNLQVKAIETDMTKVNEGIVTQIDSLNRDAKEFNERLVAAGKTIEELQVELNNKEIIISNLQKDLEPVRSKNSAKPFMLGAAVKGAVVIASGDGESHELDGLSQAALPGATVCVADDEEVLQSAPSAPASFGLEADSRRASFFSITDKEQALSRVPNHVHVSRI